MMASHNIAGKHGEGANASRLMAAANKGKRNGCGYLPPSQRFNHDEPYNFFRQRLGIHEELIRDEITPKVTKARTPKVIPAPVTNQPTVNSQPTSDHPCGAPDWEALYHSVIAELAIVKADNASLRGLLWQHAKIRICETKPAAVTH